MKKIILRKISEVHYEEFTNIWYNKIIKMEIGGNILVRGRIYIIE